MRTTVTLDPDAEAVVKRMMNDFGLTFKDAINTAIRNGAVSDPAPFETRSRSMGTPRIPLDQALRVAAEMEDDELIRKAETGK